MPVEKHAFEALKQYIPTGSFDLVMPLIINFKVQLTVTRERQTKLGDYRVPRPGVQHKISVNGNLNRYAFLITLIHELAHMLAFERFGRRIAPHGNEWKQTYAALLSDFLQENIFPEDIAAEIKKNLHNPAASTSGEEDLSKVLRRYDPLHTQKITVDELLPGTRFVIRKGRVFERGEKLRKKIKCIELPSQKVYLFSPLFEIEEIL